MLDRIMRFFDHRTLPFPGVKILPTCYLYNHSLYWFNEYKVKLENLSFEKYKTSSKSYHNFFK